MGFIKTWGGCDLCFCVDLVSILVDLLVCVSVTDVSVPLCTVPYVCLLYLKWLIK